MHTSVVVGNKSDRQMCLGYMMKFLLLGLLTVYGQVVLVSQRLTDTESIGLLFDSLGLDLIVPIEDAYTFEKAIRNDFFPYDYRMKARSGQAEVLISIKSAKSHDVSNSYPHIAFQRYLPNLSPNDDDQEIMVLSWGDRELLERNADWGAEAYLVARKEITSFKKTKFIGFYKEHVGMVFMAYCFNNPDELPLLVRFTDENALK